MITRNVVHRVFHLSIGTQAGTAFAFDRNGKEYLITTRQLLDQTGGSCEDSRIYHETGWKRIEVSFVGATESGGADIAVLAPTIRLGPDFPLAPITGALPMGQQLYSLGFPQGMVGQSSKDNRSFPVPLVKTGILSGIDSADSGALLVEGHIHAGFSGGPVGILAPAKPQDTKPVFQVAGIVAGHRSVWSPVFDREGGKEIGKYLENTGIYIARPITEAMRIIDGSRAESKRGEKTLH